MNIASLNISNTFKAQVSTRARIGYEIFYRNHTDKLETMLQQLKQTENDNVVITSINTVSLLPEYNSTIHTNQRIVTPQFIKRNMNKLFTNALLEGADKGVLKKIVKKLVHHYPSYKESIEQLSKREEYDALNEFAIECNSRL